MLKLLRKMYCGPKGSSASSPAPVACLLLLVYDVAVLLELLGLPAVPGLLLQVASPVAALVMLQLPTAAPSAPAAAGPYWQETCGSGTLLLVLAVRASASQEGTANWQVPVAQAMPTGGHALSPGRPLASSA